MSREKTNLGLYITGNASWFMFFSMQMVLFSWLVAIELNEAPDRVGMAQTALMLPVLILTLLGGVFADRFGMRRMAMLGHFVAVVPVLGLALIVATGQLRFAYLIAYALCLGVVQSFVSPARDGMLAQIAKGDIQRAVIMVTTVQFGVQILGSALAGSADHFGGGPIIVLQAAIMLVGGLAYARLVLPDQVSAGAGDDKSLALIVDGFHYVARSRFMFPVLFINVAVGLNFMGVFLVGIPLLLRDRFAATPADLAIANGVNIIGIVVMTVILLRRGGINRRGRAMLLALLFGATVVGALALPLPYWAVMALVFAWGMGGGIGMTMSRGVIQELAAPRYRARAMALYTTFFLGGAPIGAFAMGYLVKYFGAMEAMLFPAGAMVVMVALIAWFSDIWHLSGDHVAAAEAQASSERTLT